MGVSLELLDDFQYRFLCDLLLVLVLSLLPCYVELGCLFCHQEGGDLFHDCDTQISELYLPDGAEELLPVSPHRLECGHGFSKRRMAVINCFSSHPVPSLWSM